MIQSLKHIWHYIKAIKNNIGLYDAYHDRDNQFVVDFDRSQINNCYITFYGKNNKLIIEDGCSLNGVWFFFGGDNNEIRIGSSTGCNSDRRRMNLFSVAHGTKLIIGEKCLFASNIEIQTTDHHRIIDGGKQTNYSKDVVIGNHCWIAARSTILKGVTLADNTVVGACSVVVKSIAEGNCVIAGNPAGVVKHNVNWNY